MGFRELLMWLPSACSYVCSYHLVMSLEQGESCILSCYLSNHVGGKLMGLTRLVFGMLVNVCLFEIVGQFTFGELLSELSSFLFILRCWIWLSSWVVRSPEKCVTFAWWVICLVKNLLLERWKLWMKSSPPLPPSFLFNVSPW